MNSRWQIQLFGGLEAQDGDRAVKKFRTQTAAALLARLAFFPQRVHPREELADQFWPDADATTGRNNLRQTLASLRRQLEPPGTPSGSVLVADRFSIRLNPNVFKTDVAAFETAVKAADNSDDLTVQCSRLVQALELYKGELLPGFYDDWVLTERERLAQEMERVKDWHRQLRASLASSPAPSQVTLASPAPAREARLPPQFTRFFGRTEELQRLEVMFAQNDVRLITLTGPGGTGKTRLSIEAARRAAVVRHGLVGFVPLADISDPLLITGAISDFLRLPRTAGSETSLEPVIAALAEEPDALLVLDNLEQFVAGAASVILTLLSRVPRLQVLAVSRQRLYVAGERPFPLAPLPISANNGTTAEQLSAVPSIQLFVDRAQSARADFQITPRNAEAVADICRLVEGLPLSLELAAAWVQVLSPRQIIERLQERFSLLVNNRKGAVERHRTAWGAISWSYDLLSPELQRFWARLSVFRGGWTALAAQNVCEEPNALSLLTQLQARSLVLAEDDGVEMRFRVLETLREFAWGQQTPQEQAQVSRRHAHFFHDVALQAASELIGARQKHWLELLDIEDANIRAGLAWALVNDGTAALEMADALWRFWDIRGRYVESTNALEAAFAAAPDAATELRIKALAGAGSHSLAQGNPVAAQRFQELSLSLCREINNIVGISAALHNLAMIAHRTGELDRAETLYFESYEISKAQGDLLGCALTLNNRGRVAFAAGDYPAARALYEESLAIKRTLGNRQSIANSLGNLGTVAQREGDHDGAETYYRQCLQLQAEIGDRTGIALTLVNLADTARRRGDWVRIATLMAAAQAIQEGLLAVMSTSDRAEVEAIIEEAKHALGGPAFVSAWAAGSALTVEKAIEYASD